MAFPLYLTARKAPLEGSQHPVILSEMPVLGIVLQVQGFNCMEKYFSGAISYTLLFCLFSFDNRPFSLSYLELLYLCLDITL